MQLALEILLFCGAFTGVLLMLFGAPGNLVPVAIALGYWIVEGPPRFSGTIVFLFAAIMTSGEIIEQLAATFGAQKYGGSKAGMWGAFLGSILGAVVGSILLPVVGTIVFVFVGCFLATLVFEMHFARKEVAAGLRAGWGAVVGKSLGLAYKYAVGFALLGLLAWRFWFV